MCGIAGYIVNRKIGDPKQILEVMAQSLSHRGPDGQGFYCAASRDGAWSIGMAHRRLAIIDLESGHQPLSNEDGLVQVVFNGEIYNYQALRRELEAAGHSFRTNSDTETIVHAYEEWGDCCVERFRGMFAFALWDAAAERLVLARDRFGKKPLFMYSSDETVVFASEIKAILQYPGIKRAIDTDALVDYFAYRYVPGPATLFAGLQKLMPATVAVFQHGKLSERRYYEPPDRSSLVSAQVTVNPGVALLDKLDEAVRIRMVSDVPYGAFLSGGIDSSAIVALMARHSGERVRTYSVGFKEAKYSELDHAKLIATRFETDHHELTISVEHLIDHLPSLIRYRDAPIAEPSDIPIFLLAQEARKTVKMVLTGEGSDEVLAGYSKHRYERYVGAFQRWIPGWVREDLLVPAVNALPYRYRRIKTAMNNLSLSDPRERMPRWFGSLSNRERVELIRLERVHSPDVESMLPFETELGNTALRSILYFDQTSWLPDNLLERGDRMTMAASVEARMPFMDHELIAFVSSLPDHWRLGLAQGKRVLRVAMRHLLPESILKRSKVGFRVPVNEWFRSTMREYLLDHMTGPSARMTTCYNPNRLAQILNEHINGLQNHEKLLWCMLSLEIWAREYGMSL